MHCDPIHTRYMKLMQISCHAASFLIIFMKPNRSQAKSSVSLHEPGAKAAIIQMVFGDLPKLTTNQIELAWRFQSNRSVEALRLIVNEAPHTPLNNAVRGRSLFAHGWSGFAMIYPLADPARQILNQCSSQPKTTRSVVFHDSGRACTRGLSTIYSLWACHAPHY